VAEYILGMLLAQGLGIPSLLENQRRREWPKDRWKRFQPRELRESTVGIVGFGSIGRQTARLLHAFGAKVLATKRDAMQPMDSGYTPEGFGDREADYVHRLYPAEAIKSMFKECDFVVITVPLTESTQGLIGEEQLNALKPGAYLVDISRAGVLDHKALIAALNEGILSGAALDVFPEEPLPQEHPLWEVPNIIITPHISGVTRFYDERAVQMFAENLRLYLSGAQLLNTLDLKLGY
jgi:phosphoglycerate dehydrogenase-like enzyme